MSKKTAAIKNCKKIQKHFSFVLKNNILSNDFDKDCNLSTYIILFMVNQLGEEQTLTLIKKNENEFINLFVKLECNKEISDTLLFFKDTEKLEITTIESKKSIFSSFNDSFISLLSSLNVDLSLSNKAISEIVQTGLIYILHSLIDCQLDHNIDDILKDPNYDYKLHVILNNTKLFAKLKQLILSNCGPHISDFISLINGLTPKLAHD